MASTGSSLALRILLKFAINVGLAALLATQFSQYFQLTGGGRAYVIVGALLTILNLVLRPVLELLTLPLKLFATILAIIIVNAAFVQFVVWTVQEMDTELISLQIAGGLLGWAIIAVILGLGNWVSKAMFK